MGVFVDGTCGVGGHSGAIARSHPELKRLVGIDRDPNALAEAQKNLSDLGCLWDLVRGSFSEACNYLDELGIDKISGFLLDLGVSSIQLDTAERGFSFAKPGPLDMRMDPSASTSAKDIIQTWSEKELEELFSKYGEEPFARRCAKEICLERSKRPIETTEHLSQLLEKVAFRSKKIHPATRVFQALRIEVNQELNEVESILPKLTERLAPGGIGAVISFHSLEDRVVKRFIQDQSAKQREGVRLDPTVRALTKKPIIASDEEIKYNRRSRSAKLRAFQKLDLTDPP